MAGTILASAVLSTVSTLLQDTTNVRWPPAELNAYLNDGQREVALYKPNASVVTANFSTAQGTKQSLPPVSPNASLAAGLVLVDVVRCMGSSATPGRAIRVVAREVLDAQVPDWHNSAVVAQTTEFKHYVYSPLDPKNFYLYPGSTGVNAYIEIIYGAVPTAIVYANGSFSPTVISIDDIFVPALVNYVCFRAYSKDAEYAQNAAAAQAYYQLFMGQMTGKTQGEMTYNPNTAMAGFNPNVPGAK